MRTLLLLVVFLFCSTKPGFSQPGNLDLSFGSRGIVRSDIGSTFNYSTIGSQALLAPDGGIYIIVEVNGATTITTRLSDGSADMKFGNNGWSPTVPLRHPQAALQADGKIVVCGVTANPDNYADCALARFNPDGSVDETFGQRGITVTDIGGSDDIVSIVVLGDGKMLIAGNSNGFYGHPDLYYFIRYNSDGSLDNSFGRRGILTTLRCAGRRCHYVNAMAVQDDGKIVVAGTTNLGDSQSDDFIVIRYNTNGSLDSSFSSDGKQITDFNLGSDRPTALAIQSDGKIVVGGSAIARYNSNGSPDSSFDGDGKKRTEFAISSIIIQKDGKVITAGYAGSGANNDFALARYNIDGSADSTFDKDGKNLTDFTSSDDAAASLLMQPDGRLVAVGSSSAAAIPRFAVLRYNPNGNLDSSFDSDGKLTGQVDQGNTCYQSTAVQRDGKVITAGYTWNGSNFDFVLARYNKDGSPDNTFSDDGIQITDFGANDSVKSLVILKEGKILAGGSSGDNFAIARYNADGGPDNTFGNNGLQTTDLGTGDYISKLAIQDDGKIVVCGSALARYNSDGSLDNTFRFTHVICNDLALQTDGKIVAIGDDPGVSAERYNADGSKDATFQFNLDDFSSERDDDYPLVNVARMIATSIAIQNDGKIVIGGYFPEDKRSVQRVSFQVLRLGENGERDHSFNGGLANVPVGPVDLGTSLTIQSDNKIILAGYSHTESGDAFTILRFNSNGRLDNTFSDDGIQITQVSRADDRLHGIAIDNNKLYAAGYGQLPGQLGVLARYNLDESNIAPLVSIAAPPNDTLYTSPATICIMAAATDADGMITKVLFYNGGTLLYTDSVSPYTYTVENAVTGNYSFIVKATDNRGLTGSSTAITVTVIDAPNKAPLVNIIYPQHNTVYGSADTITLYAEANDPDGAIKLVRFYNGSILLYADSVSPYTYSLAATPDTSYSFVAKATDDEGLTSSSAGVAVTTTSTGNKAPFVNIYSPENNMVFAPSDSITIFASADDEDGAIRHVRFYQGASLLKTDSTSPYSCTLLNPAAGQHVIIAKATDNNGLSSSSESLCFTIASPPGEAPMVNISGRPTTPYIMTPLQ